MFLITYPSHASCYYTPDQGEGALMSPKRPPTRCKDSEVERRIYPKLSPIPNALHPYY